MNKDAEETLRFAILVGITDCEEIQEKPVVTVPMKLVDQVANRLCEPRYRWLFCCHHFRQDIPESKT